MLAAPENGLLGPLTDGLLANSGQTNGLMVPPPAAGGQIQQLKLVSSPLPVYPSLARAQSMQGDVVIDVLVDATGTVTTMKVISGPALLQQTAMDAIRTWKYEPARLNGAQIAMHAEVRISFRLW